MQSSAILDVVVADTSL